MERIVVAVALALAGAAAGSQIAGLYIGREAVLAIVGAALGAALLGLIPRRRWHVVVTAAALGGVLFGLSRWLPGPGTLTDSLTHAGARLLTSATPVPSRVDTLALPVAATWLAVSAGSALTRGRRPGAAALPLVALAATMLVLAGPHAGTNYRRTAVLVAALALLLVVVRPLPAYTRRAVPRLLRLARAVAVAVALAGGTLLLTPPLLTGVTAAPPDLRAYVVAPVQAPPQTHPLSLVGRWGVHPEQPLLRVTANRPVTLRWAVLGDFDGTSWLPATTYRAAGGERGGVRDSGIAADDVHAEITVAELSGTWLPVPDGLRRVEGVAIAVDEASGAVAVTDGLRPGLAYAVDAAVPAPTPAQLATAQLPRSAEFDRYRELPSGNTGRIPELALTAAGDGLPYAQALNLARWLKTTYRYDPRAPGGSGYPSIVRFLTGAPAAGGGRGTSEQFATAYAVLARALGIPARVVVGFTAATGTGPVTVTAADARAWPEIYLEPVGWVAIDVTAPPVTSTTAPSASPRPSLSAVPEDSADPGADPSAAPDVEIMTPEAEPADGVRGSWLWLARITAVFPLGFAVVALLRIRRSRTRLAVAGDAERVRGAWAELRDGARLGGVPLRTHWTATEVVAAVSDAVQVEPRDDLAQAVNRAEFAEPEADLAAGPAVAQATDLIHRVRRKANRRRRLFWWLDPRPLWWR
ncbi:MAG: transglutaminase domain-containing protein [Hamadaea sp.]|uniref:transglutaminase domain-containing protein n=1 Tax=Hamadaea sp. TaxID=2024425 RepID=UPI0017D07764|nr:transglutaminase domain-containing protein [Hamadaea sp.]NUT20417.1 transglutaminase domain-containing protein [Hamadaea sp.]